MKGPAYLPAKGGRKTITLQAHSHDTERAALLLFHPSRRWGRAFCRFFGVTEPARFLLNLQVAALLHDLGKANEDFIRAVSGPTPTTQALRHEHLSALFLHLPPLRDWLRRCPALDVQVITAAVLSHHIKASEEAGDYKWGQPQRVCEGLRLFMDHAEVRAILARIGAPEVTGLGEPPALRVPQWTVAGFQPHYSAGRGEARELARAVRDDDARRALLLAVKAGVIVADAAASALVRESRPIEAWIDANAHRDALTYEEIQRDVITPRLALLAERAARQGKPYEGIRPFQRLLAAQGERTLLLAACGAGKTLAAWMWAAEQARVREFGRVIFLYPTRGTATEGFRDYVGFAPEHEAALVHGTSEYELEAIAQNPNEATRDKRYTSEADARLFALRLWSRRYFSATVDQFLGFLEHAYESLCVLPALADSVLIIDEVHSFDDHMFKDLLALLTHFKVPVLCMTATLTPSRQQQLRDCGLSFFPGEAQRVELADLARLEEHPRYRHQPVSGCAEAMERAVAAYKEGKRVLWVVNQVARAQEVARQLANRSELDGRPPLCYHSRYLLKDRQEIHKKTVEAFQTGSGPQLAVTTQVCEMSLDLDADVLISELAPVTSLVQRFGRAHRQIRAQPGFRAMLHTYRPARDRPYQRPDLEAAERFMNALGAGDLSQRDLAAALETHAREEGKQVPIAPFLNSGYYATPGSFRDTDDFSQPCLLDRDMAAVAALIKARRSYDGYILSVPKGSQMQITERPDWLPRYLGIAQASRYCEELGFLMTQEETA